MDRWNAVDDYLMQTVVQEDDALHHALEMSRKNGLPAWEVSAMQGQFLYILARVRRAARILEIGTLGGYSTIWLARALPTGGVVTSLEYDSLYAEVAQGNIAYAGLSDRVNIIQGDAAETLQRLIDEKEAPYDMIFIDADKPSNPLYLKLCLQLAQAGTVIFGDNVVREGELANKDSRDAKVQGVRAYIRDLGALPGVVSTGIQTVGCKGYDGFTLSFVE